MTLTLWAQFLVFMPVCLISSLSTGLKNFYIKLESWKTIVRGIVSTFQSECGHVSWQASCNRMWTMDNPVPVPILGSPNGRQPWQLRMFSCPIAILVTASLSARPSGRCGLLRHMPTDDMSPESSTRPRCVNGHFSLPRTRRSFYHMDNIVEWPTKTLPVSRSVLPECKSIYPMRSLTSVPISMDRGDHV